MKINQSVMLSNAATFGLLLAGTQFLLTLLYWIFDVSMTSVVTSMMLGLVTLIVVIVFYWLSNKTLRDKHLGGSLTFGQGFVNLIITGLVSFIVGSILTYIFYKFIAPDYLAKMGEKVLAMVQSSPNVPQETIDKIQAQYANITPESSVLKSAPWGLGFIVVLSLIISAFTKKNPDIFAAENIDEEEK